MNKILAIMKKGNLIFTIPIIILGLLLLNACSSNEKNNNSIPETDSFTDPRDGKIYKTVKVGDQWIMAENPCKSSLDIFLKSLLISVWRLEFCPLLVCPYLW